MINRYDLMFKWLLRDIREEITNIAPVQNKSVLEIACGTGEQTKLFTEKGALVTAIDLSEEMLEIAKKKNNNSVNFLYCDATNLPFPDNHFDISTTTLCLHTVDSSTRTKIIVEMQRVTKDKGYLIFADYTLPKQHSYKASFWNLTSKIIEIFAGKEHYHNFCNYIEAGGLQTLINHLTTDRKIEYFGGNLGIYRTVNLPQNI